MIAVTPEIEYAPGAALHESGRALLGAREMSDLNHKVVKADIDQIAVADRDFMNTRPS